MLRCRMGVPLPLFIPLFPGCHTVPSQAFSSWHPGDVWNQPDSHSLVRWSGAPAAVRV